MRKLFAALGLILSLSFLNGCANKANIDLSDDYWHNKPKTIVIVSTKPFNPPQYYDANAGQNGALIELIQDISTNSLDKYLGQMDLNWYYKTLTENFQKKLSEQEHIKVIIADEQPYPDGNQQIFKKPRLNRAQLAGEYDADQVLSLTLEFYGVRTPYNGSGGIVGLLTKKPPMEGVCDLSAELSDPQHKTIYWRHTSAVTQAIPEPWNQKPNFPNVTKTILDSRDLSTQELLDSFFSGR